MKAGIRNVNELIGLEADESQKGFAAPSIYSLAEAYANIADGRYAKPFGICHGDEPVGFLMIGYDLSDEDADREKSPRSSAAI